MTIIGDNIYVTGNDGGGGTANNGALYGFNRLTLQSLTALNTPIFRYGGVTQPTAECPFALVSTRTNIAGANIDYLFAATNLTVYLGTIVGGVYTAVYATSLAGLGLPFSSNYAGAIQATCLNQSLAGVDPTTPPWFAFQGSDGNLYSVSPTGTITLAFTKSASHIFQNLTVDDDGFVWAVENGGGSTLLHKLSVNYTTGVFTNVSTVALTSGNNLTSYDVKSDGRSICVLSAGPASDDTIEVVDRIGLTVSRIIVIPGTPSGPINLGFPTRMAFDGTSMWVAIGVAGTSDGNLHVYSMQTESGEVLMDLGPFNPGGNNQEQRHIIVADDGTVITSTLSGASSLALVYTSTNVPTEHVRNLIADQGVYIGSAAIYSGTGSPNGAVVGNLGDLYLNIAGGAATTLWVKESGVNTNTGWVGK